VLLNDDITPLGLTDKSATYEHGEQCIGVVPQKELYFSPPDRSIKHRKAKVRINSWPGLDKDVHAAPHHYFRVRALSQPGAKEIVPQIEMGLNPHIGLAQGHEGCNMQDPRRSQMMQLQAIEL
jgi:hypothetical protein